jgi:YbbR domain-containing protein
VLKIASLLLAFLLWFLVALTTDPTDKTTFYNIPVSLINTELLEKENKVYEVLDNTDTVRVTVRAPRSVIQNLRSSDVVAEADMSRLTEVNTIAISLSVENADKIESITCSPEVLKLNVDEKSSKWIRVQYETVGETAEDYVVSSTSIDQTQIEVTGPKASVEQISYAGISIDVSGATTSISANVEVQLYDADGGLLDLPSVTKNINYVHMSVEVLATKEVPVELNVTGEPAEGYLLTGVAESSPSVLKLAGTTSVLSGISKISIPAEKLDVTGESATVETLVDIRDYLPDKVKLADSTSNGRVRVIIYIEPEYTKTFEIQENRISVTNVPEGLTAELADSDETYELKVSGLESAVNSLSASAMRGTVNVEAWMEDQEITDVAGKTYTIPVTFPVGDNVVVEEPVTVRITFTKLEE